MDDDKLLTQYVRDGSEAAFSQLVARHLTLVYATCLREIASPSQAEDAAQVVFLLLARKAKTLRPAPSLASWLFKTARFVAKDACKQEVRRRRREEAVMQEAVHAQTAPAPEWDSIKPLLNAALSALKPADRDAVLLRFLEGHTLAETGALLGVTEDAARMRCARALDKMRRYFASHRAAVTGLALTSLLASEAAHPVPAHASEIVTQATLQALANGPASNVLLLSKEVSHTMNVIKLKYAVLAASVLVGGAISVSLTASPISKMIGLSQTNQTSSEMAAEYKIETATSSNDASVRSQALNNLVNQAIKMRMDWQSWAEPHSTMLREMYLSDGQHQDTFTKVCNSLPRYPSLGADAGKSGVLHDDISSKKGVFTWQPIEENIATFDTGDPKYKLLRQEVRDRLFSNFVKYHDIVISVSVNSGPVRIELWASGRITENQFESKFVGHHMPFKNEWHVVSEIKPPFDFVAQNHSPK